ncbi:2825_t:CDS:2 [Diversispora eburnea]|uniref:2825_t:CDS:1 n=1 Tax=Diversispora eburnea TaxID=1213867 RepID=A0A9N9F5Q2_9GLOM|nr:2825_t:CDS:2 [Diversispora eburnea]
MTQTKKKSTKRVDKNHKKNRSLKSIQRGEQKIKLDIHKERLILPYKLPFPPSTQVDELVAKLILKPKLARFPNGFILFRNEYVQLLKGKGLNYPMTQLSPMIAAKWKKESSIVRDTFSQISSEAEKLYVQHIAQQHRLLDMPVPLFSEEQQQSWLPPNCSPESNTQENSNESFNEQLFQIINGIDTNAFIPTPPYSRRRNFISLPPHSTSSCKSNKSNSSSPTFPLTPTGSPYYSIDLENTSTRF